jgi:hypothetical protein
MAVSSLTVARQRGIFTRFPVFAERQRRAFRTNITKIEEDQRSETIVAKNLTADHIEVKYQFDRGTNRSHPARTAETRIMPISRGHYYRFHRLPT